MPGLRRESPLWRKPKIQCPVQQGLLFHSEGSGNHQQKPCGNRDHSDGHLAENLWFFYCHHSGSLHQNSSADRTGQLPVYGQDPGGLEKKQVKTLEDIQALDAEHKKRKQDKKQSKPAAPASGNRFNNFQQREYNFDEYEKRLLNQ